MPNLWRQRGDYCRILVRSSSEYSFLKGFSPQHPGQSSSRRVSYEQMLDGVTHSHAHLYVTGLVRKKRYPARALRTEVRSIFCVESFRSRATNAHREQTIMLSKTTSWSTLVTRYASSSKISSQCRQTNCMSMNAANSVPAPTPARV